MTVMFCRACEVSFPAPARFQGMPDWSVDECGRCERARREAEREAEKQRAQLMTDLIDFVQANEFGGGVDGGDYGMEGHLIRACLDCGAEKGTGPNGVNQPHSEQCAWTDLMRRAGRRT